MNPYSEEEFVEYTTSTMRDQERAEQQKSPLPGTSASSFQQELERQHSVEVSSTRPQSRQSSDIKKTFTDIKARNDPVRMQLYNHLLRTTPTNQQRLMAAYDIQEKKMILSHLKPKTQQPQSAADYIRTNLEYSLKIFTQLTILSYINKLGRWCMPPWQIRHCLLTNCKIHCTIPLPN